MSFLNSNVYLFYPEHGEIVEQTRRMLESLGSGLEIPRLPWKYAWIQKVFGWRAAKHIQLAYNEYKKVVVNSLDQAYSRLEKRLAPWASSKATRRAALTFEGQAPRGGAATFEIPVLGFPSESTKPRVEVAEPEESYEHHFATAHLLSDLRGRTVSNSAITAVAQGAQFLLTMVSTMVLARLLSPQDFGVVAVVTTIIGFLQVFKEAGLSTATVQREGVTHAQVSNLFWINVGVSGFISLALAASAPVLAWFFREAKLVGVTLALAGTFILSGATVQHMALLNRQMRFRIVGAIQVGSMLIGVSIGIVMAWLGCGPWSLVGMNLGTACSTLILTWSASHWRPQFFKPNSGTRPLLHFGVNLAAGGFIWALARGSDRLMVGRVFGSDAIGLYSRAAVLITRPLEQALGPIETVLVPTLSRMQAEPARYRRAFLSIFETIALLSFICGALLFALARPVTLVVLGAKWEKAAPIFAAFTVSALFYPFWTMSTWLFSSQGRGKDWLLSSSITAAIAVCAFTAGLPFGPTMVAASYSLCSVIILLPIMFYFSGRTGSVTTRNLWGGFLRQFPVWAVVCGGTLLLRRLTVGSSPIIECLICGPAGALIGAAFVAVYPPARTVAMGMVSTVRSLRQG